MPGSASSTPMLAMMREMSRASLGSVFVEAEACISVVDLALLSVRRSELPTTKETLLEWLASATGDIFHTATSCPARSFSMARPTAEEQAAKRQAQRDAMRAAMRKARTSEGQAKVDELLPEEPASTEIVASPPLSPGYARQRADGILAVDHADEAAELAEESERMRRPPNLPLPVPPSPRSSAVPGSPAFPTALFTPPLSPVSEHSRKSSGSSLDLADLLAQPLPKRLSTVLSSPEQIASEEEDSELDLDEDLETSAKRISLHERESSSSPELERPKPSLLSSTASIAVRRLLPHTRTALLKERTDLQAGSRLASLASWLLVIRGGRVRSLPRQYLQLYLRHPSRSKRHFTTLARFRHLESILRLQRRFALSSRSSTPSKRGYDIQIPHPSSAFPLFPAWTFLSRKVTHSSPSLTAAQTSPNLSYPLPQLSFDSTIRRKALPTQSYGESKVRLGLLTW